METNEELNEIMKVTGTAPVNCACHQCANMCLNCPCLGTPADIVKLIKNGHIDKLQLVHWAAGIALKVPVIDMVQLIKTKEGPCIMFDRGLCKLHDTGLKPTEGVLVSHNSNLLQLKGHMPLPVAVALTWLNDENMAHVEFIAHSIIQHDKAKRNATTTPTDME